MKKFLQIALLTLLPVSAIAQSESPLNEPDTDRPVTYWASKPVQCSSVSEMIKLVTKYGEVPNIRFKGTVGTPAGSPTESQFVIAMNKEKKTWTLIEFTGGDQACIIAVGEGDIIIPQEGIKT